MMGFFNEDFYKDLENDYEDGEDEIDEFNFDRYDNLDSNYYVENMELEVNKHNKDIFKNIMDNASTKYDDYWDTNNPIIRFILVLLFVIIVVGLLCYIIGWFTIM